MNDHEPISQVRQRTSKTICECTHSAPEEDHFCTAEEQYELALDYQSLVKSNPGRVRWAENEIYFYHAGDLLDFDGQVIDFEQKVGFDKEDGAPIRRIDQILTEYPGHAMKRLISRVKGEHVNMLDDEANLRMRHLLFYHAMQIHRCRTIGRCSRRKADEE